MAQLTLQAPTALPPEELGGYLEQLWQHDLDHSAGAATFSLVVWEGSWLEQQLVRSGRADGPITGLLSPELLEAARAEVAGCGLPISTAPMDPRLAWALGKLPGSHHTEDLRGQFVESAISAHMPRRLITLAPTLEEGLPLETKVAAYCPLPEEGGGRHHLRGCGGAAGQPGGPAPGAGADPTSGSPGAALLGVVEQQPG